MSSHGTKFDPKWQKEFPFIEEVSQDAYKAKCNACGAIFSKSHGGKTTLGSVVKPKNTSKVFRMLFKIIQ
jgi:hypothetical protein